MDEEELDYFDREMDLLELQKAELDHARAMAMAEDVYYASDELDDFEER